MKKLCSAVLTAVMLTQGFGAVSFADTTDQTGTADPPEVLYQQTFSDWNEASWNANSPAPGMTLAHWYYDNSYKGTKFTNLKPHSEDDGNKSALMFNDNNSGYWYQWNAGTFNGAFDVIPFGKNIESGKLYISMDVYIPDKVSDDRKINGSTAITLFNNSTQDYTVNAEGTDRTCVATGGYKANEQTGVLETEFIGPDAEWQAGAQGGSDSAVTTHQSTLANISANTDNGTDKTEVTAYTFARTNSLGVGTNNEGLYHVKSGVARDSWHKLQIMVDCDQEITSTSQTWKANPIKVYLDGEAVSETASVGHLASDTSVTGYKGIGFYRSGWYNGGMRFDNVYVSHYTNSTDVKMMEEESDMSDKKISVAFTDNLTKTPDASDFTITNVDTGKAVKGYTVSGTNAKATFDFSSASGVPKNGKMTIAAKDTITGSITKAKISNSLEIKVSGTEVLYQETFSDYSADGWNDTTPAPGMVLADADLRGISKVYFTNLKPYTEEDGNQSALMFRKDNSGYEHQWYEESRNGAFDVIPFNKVINDGKIYVSMDFYVPEYAWNYDDNRYYNDSDLKGDDSDNQLKSNGVNAITIFNTSTVDYDVNYDGTNWTYKATGENLNDFIAADSAENHSAATDYRSNHQSQLAYMGFSPNSFTIATGAFTRIQFNATKEAGATNKWTETTKEQWHKLQIVIDCDNTIKSSDGKWEGNPVKVWVDGTLYHENASTAKFVSDNVSGYKGIGLYRRGWARPGVRYDNMYVSHYKTEKQDSVKLLEDEKDFSDKKVSVAFTEYLNKAPEASDFDVKTNVGTPIEGYTVSGDARKATFDFTNATKLPIDGKVIITPKNTLTGKISGLNVSGSMEIPFGFSGTNVFEKQDEDGTWFAATTVAAGDKVRAHINVVNGYSEPKSMVYIIAKYTKDDDGSLILSEIIKSESVPCEANGSKELMTDIVNPDSGAVYKAFVWNADGYRPFMESAVIQ